MNNCGKTASKFDELCVAYANARKERIEFEHRSYEFASQFYKKFIKYFGVDEKYVKCVPLDKYDMKVNYAIPGSVNLKDNGLWEFGIVFTLFETPTTYPQMNMLTRVNFKINENDSYKVIISEDNTYEFDVTKDDDSSFCKVFECIYNLSKEQLENGFKNFLEQIKQ